MTPIKKRAEYLGILNIRLFNISLNLMKANEFWCIFLESFDHSANSNSVKYYVITSKTYQSNASFKWHQNQLWTSDGINWAINEPFEFFWRYLFDIVIIDSINQLGVRKKKNRAKQDYSYWVKSLTIYCRCPSGAWQRLYLWHPRLGHILIGYSIVIIWIKFKSRSHSNFEHE